MSTVTPSTLIAGSKVGAGRFSLVRELGRGGMGVVWLAQDGHLNEDAALKFLPPEVAADASALDDLRRETQKSRRLTHPNIIRIHDFYHPQSELPFISMELVDGSNLSALRLQQSQRCFPWHLLHPLAMQLCGALEYAHNEKIVHRDLKPSNLMADSKGRLKLADFGIAATMSDSMNRTSLRHPTSGTLMYMSPQQMRGEKPQPTDDIYSLGITLYELLSSRPPFYTGDISYQVRDEKPPQLADRLAELEIAHHVPALVLETIMSCLAKDPAQRPQSIHAVADLLAKSAPASQTRSDSSEPQPTQGEEAPPTIDQAKDEPCKSGWQYQASVVELYRAANLGNLKAIVQLGDRACFGLGDKVDYKLAEKWYRLAAEKKYPTAWGRMGYLCHTVPLLTGGREAMLRWLGEGVDLKDPVSMVKWGGFLVGDAWEASAKKAEELAATALPKLRLLGEAGDACAIQSLCEINANNRMPRIGYPEEIKWCKKSMAAGNASVISRLGEMYDYGLGMDKNPAEAIKCYCKSAEAGCVAGMIGLGHLYHFGEGIVEDQKEAVKWYRKAADLGSARGANWLGDMYQKSPAVKLDLKEAVRWYRKAADAGDAKGMFNLGNMYESCYGTIYEKMTEMEEEKESVRWYHKAAEAGSAEAASQLGVIYENGRGVNQDYTKAFKYYQHAANGVDAYGAYSLGRMYEEGLGITKDREQAIRWYQSAVEWGSSYAKDGLKRLGAG